MNNLFVYCEIEDGIIADVSLELLTKGRSLANQLNCKLEALVIGSNLDGVENKFSHTGLIRFTLSMTKGFILIRHSLTHRFLSTFSKRKSLKSVLWEQPASAAI